MDDSPAPEPYPPRDHAAFSYSYTGSPSASVEQHEAEPAGEVATGSRPSVVALAGGLVALLVLSIGGWLLFSGSNPATGLLPGDDTLPAGGAPRVGSAALDFSLSDPFTGQAVSLSDFRGRPVWINFWASWCPPCREELPIMQRLYRDYKDAGLVILGINVQERQEDVRNYLSSGAYEWTFLLDESGAVTNDYHVGGLPTHIFIDRTGVIKALRAGPVTESDARTHLRAIIPGR